MFKKYRKRPENVRKSPKLFASNVIVIKSCNTHVQISGRLCCALSIIGSVVARGIWIVLPKFRHLDLTSFINVALLQIITNTSFLAGHTVKISGGQSQSTGCVHLAQWLI